MKQKDIDIYEILKGMPADTELYTPMCGRVGLSYMALNKEFEQAILVKNKNGEYSFNKNGKVSKEGEVLLFPSNEMRSWHKFAWKTGDVLVSNDGKREVLFKTWVNDSYTKFVGLHCLINNDNEEVEYDNGTTVFNTNDFKGIETEDAAQTYINTIEERLGGKLNRETLEVEKPQPEFKDGDIAFADYGNRQDVFVVSDKTDLSEGYNSFISLDLRGTLSMGYRTSFFKKDLCKLRLATEEEKQKLFDALAKEGKRWDSEKKQIVDLKPKVELKPFDRVLCRDDIGKEWHIDLFESVLTDNSEYNYKCMVNVWKICIPYEGNEYLLGTTNDTK